MKETPYGFIKIIDDTGELLREAQTRSDNAALSEWQKKYANGILKFSEKELSKMPSKVKKQFKVGNVTAHIRKKKNGVFEIRSQIERQRLSVSSKDFDTAKEKFITAVNDLFATPNAVRINKHVKFCDYMRQWLATVKKPTVKAVTLEDYDYTAKTYIYPEFEGRELSDIKGFELQAFFNRFAEAGKHRTAKKIYNLLLPVFEYAVMDDIIIKSPMQRIALPTYEQEHGTPLTRTEEAELVGSLRKDRELYAQAFAFMIYTGVRRSELASAELQNGWIKITTSKQRKGLKEKLRFLPVSPMLAKVLPLIDLKAIKAITPAMLTKHIKDYFPHHHAHDLRHTFITRCQECGIQRELVSLWAGHTADSSTTTVVYTHLEQNREHQAEEMQKFDYLLA